MALSVKPEKPESRESLYSIEKSSRGNSSVAIPNEGCFVEGTSHHRKN
jgi:hypothetical protein